MTYLEYKFNENKLYQLKDKDVLCQLLGLTIGYFENNNLKKQLGYNIYSNKKGREIENPTKNLKTIQKNIHNLISEINFPSWVISVNKNVSYIDNAKFHSDNNYIVKLDIKSFYGSCNKKCVYDLFHRDFCMSSEISGLLSNLVCIEKRLPTGAPSSPLISYLAYLRMFEELKFIAESNGYIISVYVDDITISSSSNINYKVINDMVKVINFYGFNANNKKRVYVGPKLNKKITGVIVNKNKELKVPNNRRKEVIDLFKEVQSMRHNKEDIYFLKKVRSLRGKLNSCRNIESDIFPNIHNQLLEIERRCR